MIIKLLFLCVIFSTQYAGVEPRLPPTDFHTLRRGSRVIRGDDWIWQDQDGGAGNAGTVVEITKWDNQENCGAKVLWDNGKWNVYRWGAGNGTVWDLDILRGHFVENFTWIEPEKPSGQLKNAKERVSLMELYAETGGNTTWRISTNWGIGDPCLNQWEGVKCSIEGKLIALRLDNNNLQGELPPSIGKFSNLVTLDLSYNKLKGLIPDTLSQLSQLRFLELHQNLFEGSIPPSLAFCSQLEWISLTRNKLSGTIPQELGNLKSLRYLHLAFNKFEGKVPPFVATIRQHAESQVFMEGNQNLVELF